MANPQPMLPHRYNPSGDICPAAVDEDLIVSFRHEGGPETISEQELS